MAIPGKLGRNRSVNQLLSKMMAVGYTPGHAIFSYQPILSLRLYHVYSRPKPVLYHDQQKKYSG